MKNVQKELIAISTALSSLVKKMEKVAEAIEKGSGKATPKKKAKPGTKAKAPVKKAKASAKKSKATPKKKAPKKKAMKKKVPKKKAPKKKAPVKAKASAAAGAPTILDKILGMISRSKNGITVERLKKRVGLEARQVSNALYKLTQKGKIETLSRGVYVKKKK